MPRGAGCEVDVVEADAEPADRFEPASGLQHRAPNLCPIAHDQRPRRPRSAHSSSGRSDSVGS
jgi:hypothetical protein